MQISVILPTYKRPVYLARALEGLSRQARAADEIVIGIREGDRETTDFLTQARAPHFQTVVVSEPGVLASMSAALERTHGDVVCLLDDDAEPFPDWVERIGRRFAGDPRLGVLGGRDLLQDHPEMRAAESLVRNVGRFTWYGRLYGNHHRGGGAYREVHCVKGCNAAVRGPLLREMGFARGLRGTGAQVNWELALCLDAARRGWRVAYDPGLRVLHHIAPRHGPDQIHRGHFSAEATYDMVWNEHFVIRKYAGTLRRLRHLAWSLLVGSLAAPGIVQYLRLARRRDPNRREIFHQTLRAIRDARLGSLPVGSR